MRVLDILRFFPVFVEDPLILKRSQDQISNLAAVQQLGGGTKYLEI